MKKLILSIAFAVACFGQAQPGLRLAVCADAGANDTYTCTAAPTVTSYTGLKVLLTVNTANTGAATLNIDSVGAKTIVKIAGGISTTLEDNDLVPKGTYILVYNATDDNFKVISATGTAGSGGNGLGMFGHVVTASITGSANQVYSPYGFATAQSVANEGRVAMEVPAACTVRNLRVKEATAQPSGGSLDVTVRVNGSDSAVTCSVAVAGTTCSDTSNTASITAGQMLSVHTVNNSSSATTYVSISFQCN